MGDTTTESAIEFAEQVTVQHLAIATHENRSIAGGTGAIYKASQDLVLAAYALAFPDLDPQHVYDVWTDCNESARHCAAWVRTNGPL